MYAALFETGDMHINMNPSLFGIGTVRYLEGLTTNYKI